MKCKICKAKVVGSLCPVCGNVSPYHNATISLPYDKKRTLWKRVLACDRIIYNEILGGMCCALFAIILSMLCHDVLRPAAWLGFYIGATAFRCMRSYLPSNLFTLLGGIALGIAAGYTIGSGAQWLFSYLDYVPYLGKVLMVVIDLAILVGPSVVITQVRNKTKKELTGVIAVQGDWDKFASELTYEYATEVHKNARKGRGFRGDTRFVRRDFMDKVVPRYQSRISEAMTPKVEEE